MEGEQQYDVEALRLRFLLLLEQTGGSADLYPIHVAKQFPRILAKIVDLWGTVELDYYFEKDLLTTNRPNRHGFDADIAMELFRLSNFHASFDLRPPAIGGPWEVGADVDDPKKRGFR